MKLLLVRAWGFGNCRDGAEIFMTPCYRKTSEDREYNLLEIAPGLHVFNTAVFIGKNASGKSTALKLLDCCSSILGGSRPSKGAVSCDGARLEIFFHHGKGIYLYDVTLKDSGGPDYTLTDGHIFKKSCRKGKFRELFDRKTCTEITPAKSLSKGSSPILSLLGEPRRLSFFLDAQKSGAECCSMARRVLKEYDSDGALTDKIIRILDESITHLEPKDDGSWSLAQGGRKYVLSDAKLAERLSGGTQRGLLLYALGTASLRTGLDLMVDELECHLDRTLIFNLWSLYRDKTVNRHNASLIFSTNRVELLDYVGRRDEIFVCHADPDVHFLNMHSVYRPRTDLLRSRLYYKNAFGTAICYDDLMDLKKALKHLPGSA